MLCPTCDTDLEPCGVIEVGGITMPVYQCESCTVVKDIFGEPFEVAATFVVTPDGRRFDPSDE